MEIENYEDNYLIYPDGRVQNKISNRFLKPYNNKNGYYMVSLCKDGERKKFYIHRLIAIHYIPNTNPNFKIINHKNGDRIDNSIDNLEWCDNLYNTQSKNKNTNVGNVYFRTDCITNPYEALIRINGVRHRNYFKTEQEAREWLLSFN